MSSRQVHIADQVAGKYARLAGYPRTFEGFNLWIALLALPGICFARLIYFLTGIIDRMPYRIREKILSKGPLWLAGLARHLFSRKSG
jgi:hypothetical protein